MNSDLIWFCDEHNAVMVGKPDCGCAKESGFIEYLGEVDETQ